MYCQKFCDQNSIALLFWVALLCCIKEGGTDHIQNKKKKRKQSPKNFSVLEKYGMEIQPGLIIDSCEKITPLNENAFFYPVFRIGESRLAILFTCPFTVSVESIPHTEFEYPISSCKRMITYTCVKFSSIIIFCSIYWN